mmetsp:Transcript_12205/g.19167  ORF Transcript_12205/g.19167 Transcript_12205/m.19167 type:complete len:330 (-) Transcript_12205:1760-2749(-)
MEDLQGLAPQFAPFNPQQGVIVILTSNQDKDLKDLRHALGLVDVNLNTSMPILIFHDGLSDQQAEDIKGWTRRDVTLEYFKLKDTEYERLFEARGGKWYRQVAEGQVSRNYMHMIRFYAGMLFQHPILHYYEYYVRLDTDSYFLGPSTDPVQQLKDHTSFLRNISGHPAAKASYGYWWLSGDQEMVTMGFWDAAQHFMDGRGTVPNSLEGHLMRNGEWNRDIYYNNLEVVRLQWIRSALCTDFFRFLDANLLWFERRWSDAVVRSMQVFMSLQEFEALRLLVSYRHQEPFICVDHEFVSLSRDLDYPPPDICPKHGERWCSNIAQVASG